MSNKQPPIVAGINRPETPEETAARKAESSRIYRSSQTARHLIAALAITLGVVVIIVFGVPRGKPVEQPAIDLATIAVNAETSLDRDLIVPEIPEGWRVTTAEVEGGNTKTWNIAMAPTGADDRGFLRLTQAADSDASWAAVPLRGAQATDTTTIDGIEWQTYEIANPEASGNISYALGTQVGTDYLLLYGGALGAERTADFASELTPQIRALTDAS